jgi:forkhead protein FKH
MKWMIAPEHRQEYWKKQAKRNGGSAPSSPASSKEVNPNFRGPNGQNLGYDTTMVTSFSAKDNGVPQSGGNKLNFQPPPLHPAPQLAPIPNLAPPYHHHQETVTPQRRRTDTGATLPDSTLDDSPLPTRSRPTPHPNGPPMYTLPSSVPPPHRSPTNPTLSSSYLDTPFHHSQRSSIITPAPMRQNPRLAPPSTLVAPSKFMPESSPAGPGLFWKGMMGVTPGHPVPDLSPVKVEDDERGSTPRGLDSEADRQVMSSSPPPIDVMGSGSPSKPFRGSQAFTSSSARKERDEHARSRSASATVSVSGPNARAVSGSTPGPGIGAGGTGMGFTTNANAHVNQPTVLSPIAKADREEEEDDAEGGFDLAKGFAPIARGLGPGPGAPPRRFGL